MATQKKINSVTKLTDQLSRAKSVVVADYRGLKHKQLEDLRKVLKKVEADFTIAKNRLFKRALKSLSTFQGKPSGAADQLDQSLSQTTAVLFSYGDEVAPIKELLKFFKTTGFGTAKAGLLGTYVLSEGEVTRLAALPTREALLGQLVRQLNAPIQGLHYALSWNINRLVWAIAKIKDQK